jgi:hypothetical protein
MRIIECKVSCKLFQGYSIKLDLDYHNSLDSICKQVKKSLVTFFNTHGFEALESKAKSFDFHIHDYQFGDILLMEEETIIWVCHH